MGGLNLVNQVHSLLLILRENGVRQSELALVYSAQNFRSPD